MFASYIEKTQDNIKIIEISNEIIAIIVAIIELIVPITPQLIGFIS